jgi:hypothetical protein
LGCVTAVWLWVGFEPVQITVRYPHSILLLLLLLLLLLHHRWGFLTQVAVHQASLCL